VGKFLPPIQISPKVPKRFKSLSYPFNPFSLFQKECLIARNPLVFCELAKGCLAGIELRILQKSDYLYFKMTGTDIALCFIGANKKYERR
jgi:hypothetical protein